MRLSPGQIRLGGWLAFMLYAFPGYMSYDSVYQLSEARWGYYTDGHPPAMAELWRHVDGYLAGPLGMLIIQSVCFLTGTFLAFRTRMQPRTASIASVIVLLFPPIAAFMAVIWKDSQMVAWLVLGTGLLLQPSRRMRVAGLVALFVGTAMRHNALVITLPIVGLLFVWNPDHRWWKRYAVAVAAWIAITMSARVVTNALTDDHQYLWTNSIAMCDIAATLRYTNPTIPDDKLRELMPGVRLYVDSDIHEHARAGDEEHDDFVVTLWNTTYRIFAIPRDEAERAAIVKAWKNIVLSHPQEYLTYRWKMFARVIGFVGDTGQSPIYNWFTDVQDPYGSALRIDHDAGPSKIQDVLRRGIHVLGRTPLFRVSVYVVLSMLLIPFCLRDRESLALVLSALASEGILLLIAPTTDWRYSCWLVVAVVFALVLTIARRSQNTEWTTASKMKQ